MSLEEIAMSKNSLGVKLLGVYLIVEGLTKLLSFTIPYATILLGILALLAGIFLLVGR